MAEQENHMARELLSLISPYGYNRHVPIISSRDALSEDDFEKKVISCQYWIDKRNSYHNRFRNGNFLFELFGQYSGEDGDFVHSNMLELIKLDKDFYQSVGHTVLNIRGTNIDEWLVDMEDPNMFPDKLMLYALSRAYNRHTVVVCKECNWSTVATTDPINENDLFNICQLHLIYLGCSVFACLHRKLFTSNIAANPITMEQMSAALMQVKGKGHQCKPLNLTTPKLDSNPFALIKLHECNDNTTVETVGTEHPEQLDQPELFEPVLPLNVDSMNQAEASELDGALSCYDSQSVCPGMEQEITTTTTTTTSNIDGAHAATANVSINPSDSNEPGMVDPSIINRDESNDHQIQVQGEILVRAQTVWDVTTGLHYHNYDQISEELAELKSTLPNLSVLKDLNHAIKGQNQDSEDIELNLETEQTTPHPTTENLKGDNKVPTLEEVMKGCNITSYVNNLFKKNAEINGSYIPIDKMSAHFLKFRQPSQRSPSIDPYSSLEGHWR